MSSADFALNTQTPAHTHTSSTRRTGDIHIHFEFDGVQRADSGSGEGTRRARALDVAAISTNVEAHGQWHRHGDEEADGVSLLPSSLWALTTHLAPSVLAPTTDYLLFHAAMQRPVWEDPLNIPGGKRRACVRCGGGVCRVWGGGRRGGCARRSWEDAVEGKNGTSREDAGDTDAPEICECTISVQQSEDIISLWNRVDDARGHPPHGARPPRGDGGGV
ncbi:hypothetical protein B0H14DRAFT_3443476 [Mycena olivaceomarginata]|nr:hypothetical protein B0H14DRAFT_3443476 [Mycena olivaceomarginata]